MSDNEQPDHYRTPLPNDPFIFLNPLFFLTNARHLTPNEAKVPKNGENIPIAGDVIIYFCDRGKL